MLILPAAMALVALVIYDILYRIFVIHPHTNLSGIYATFIEEDFLYRWVGPVALGRRGKIEVIFAGNSHVMDGVDPKIVQEETGLRAFNLALYILPAQNLLDLLLKHNQYPDWLFIDFCPSYAIYEKGERVQERVSKAIEVSATTQLLFNLADRFSSFFPSLFVPNKYRPIVVRCLSEYRKYRVVGRMYFKRYTPYAPFASWEWWLDKSTNHRLAIKRRDKTWQELASETDRINRQVEMMDTSCPLQSEEYEYTFRETARMVSELSSHSVRIVLMRMPEHSVIVEHENRHFSRFFEDVQSIALRHGLEYLDLTESPHREHLSQLEFYADGQHLYHSGAETVSRYLSWWINQTRSMELAKLKSTTQTN